MNYKAIEYFTDLQDGEYAYSVGDEYPRKGYTPSDARIEELSTDKNVRHRPVITAVEEPAAIAADEKTAEVQENKPKKRRKREE